jgi:hypothetical protein
METSTNKSKKNLYSRIGLTFILFIAIYFIIQHALRYFNLTEEAYGPYFWPRMNWVFPHVICGMLALLIGPFQFSNQLRATYLKWHRRSGYVYLTAVFIGGIAGIGLALTSQVNLTYQWGLMFLAIAWLLTSGMAFLFIKNRKTTQHKEWMVRSYVVTFAFVFFRLFDDLLVYLEIGDRTDQLALMSWACWAVPLLFTEAILQYRKTFKRR